MKYIELKNLARKAFPCKIFRGKNFLARSFKEKISLQDLSRKTFPCKIFQGKHFLARSCKEQISLQDLTSNCIFTRILQDPCKERIFSRPGNLHKSESQKSRKIQTKHLAALRKVTKLYAMMMSYIWFHSTEFAYSNAWQSKEKLCDWNHVFGTPSRSQNGTFRSLCSLNHGTYDWGLKRCFFIQRHSFPGLTFRQEATFCNSKKTALSYPRSRNEVIFLWKFFKEKFKKDLSVSQLANTTLRTGLVKDDGSLFDCNYTSLDNKFSIISSKSSDWFTPTILMGKIVTRNLNLLNSPNVCIRRNRKVYSCSQHFPSMYSICSIDILRFWDGEWKTFFEWNI